MEDDPLHLFVNYLPAKTNTKIEFPLTFWLSHK